MDYKKKYEELVGKIEKAYLFAQTNSTKAVLEEIRPILKEIEDERIKNVIYGWIYIQPSQFFDNGFSKEEMLAWLEKQGEQKPTLPKWRYKKDNTPLLRDSLILNKYGCVVKSPSGALVSDVWVIDYDELAKLPKEEFEKQGEKETDEWKEGNIIRHGGILALVIKGRRAMKSNGEIFTVQYPDEWVKAAPKEIEYFLNEFEKQSEQPQGKSALEAAKEEKVDNQNCVKPADKVEPKFHEGEWLTENHPNSYARFVQILEIVNVQGKNRYRISRDLHNDEDIVECRFVEDNWHSFNIQDAKDADVLATSAGAFIYNGNNGGGSCPGSYCGINSLGRFQTGVKTHWTWKNVCPATKEQRDTLEKAMADAGYTFDFDKKELKKIEQKPAEWSEEDERICQCLIEDQEESLDKVSNDKHGHSEIISDLTEMYDERIDWLKSIKDRVGCEANCTTTWKPSDEQIEAIRLARSFVVDDFSESPTLSDILVELEKQLKKL